MLFVTPIVGRPDADGALHPIDCGPAVEPPVGPLVGPLDGSLDGPAGRSSTRPVRRKSVGGYVGACAMEVGSVL